MERGNRTHEGQGEGGAQRAEAADPQARLGPGPSLSGRWKKCHLSPGTMRSPGMKVSRVGKGGRSGKSHHKERIRRRASGRDEQQHWDAFAKDLLLGGHASINQKW